MDHRALRQLLMRGRLNFSYFPLQSDSLLAQHTNVFDALALLSQRKRSLLAQDLLLAGCAIAILFYVINTPRRQFFTAF